MEIYISVSCIQIIENLAIFSANALAVSPFILYTHTHTNTQHICVCVYIYGLLLDYKEINPINPKENQSWIFTGRTSAEAETPILWPPDVKNWLIGKDPDAGKDWRRRKGDDRGWHGWMASPTQWTWVWVKSGSWQWTGRPGLLQSMALQGVLLDWVTQLNWLNSCFGPLTTS